MSPSPQSLPSRPSFRAARRADIPAIVAMLIDDPIAAARESLDGADYENYRDYEAAFAAIDADPRNELIVVEVDGEVAGTMQLTFIPGLSRRGAERAQIEAVRVAAPYRNRGIGRTMMEWAVERARDRGCALVQLTSDKARSDAHRFYTGLGFTASHEGFKLRLS
ncbi:GNAT family N-acetyltransferase [Planotetraspora sp. A-T 1434]|uniref:GNAT family N-acetyltransferase n=1 Tax=Planotetraspora sp. A-T 1434 TaxID=2979219 RepID=UPI0021C0C1C6|nr:GNAT family N-acetyltransferase [Planotetraspora sp. A-T 1434]MCT9934069.1 GNAT family N-acetyltransferase [Planotetraspora sp. A-T 1434]